MALSKYIDCEAAYDYATLEDWYINSVSDTDNPVWTTEHLEELLNDFHLIPKDTNIVEVVRCENCKYLLQDLSERKAHVCMQNPYIRRNVNLDDFCSCGEQIKENNKESKRLNKK